MVSPEGWLRQQRKVLRIESRAAALRRQSADYRGRMWAWFSRIAPTELLAWSFAAGLVWASGVGRSTRRVVAGRALARLASTALGALRFLHRVRVAGTALGLSETTRPASAAKQTHRTLREGEPAA